MHTLQDNMKAFKTKLDWNYLQQRSLCAKFAKSRFTVGKSGSLIWKSVSKRIHHLKYRSYHSLGDGNFPIDGYCWLYDIPCKSDLKGISIKTVLERPKIRYKFLNGP